MEIANANDDIHELVYNIEADKFNITYHRDSNKIAPSTREFLKPANWNDKGNTWSWSNDLHMTYQVNLKQTYLKRLKANHFFLLLI